MQSFRKQYFSIDFVFDDSWAIEADITTTESTDSLSRNLKTWLLVTYGFLYWATLTPIFVSTTESPNTTSEGLDSTDDYTTGSENPNVTNIESTGKRWFLWRCLSKIIWGIPNDTTNASEISESTLLADENDSTDGEFWFWETWLQYSLRHVVHYWTWLVADNFWERIWRFFFWYSWKLFYS